MDQNGDTPRPSSALQQRRPSDNGRTSVTIPVPKVLQRWISTLERQPLVPIVAVVCVETAFLKFIRRSNADVLSAIFFTVLSGSLAWPVWSNLKRVHCRLDEVFAKIEALQQSIKSLEPTAVTRPSIEYVPIPAFPNGPAVLRREDPAPKPIAKPVIKPNGAQPERPVEHPVAATEPHNPPYEIVATPEPAKPLAIVEDKPPTIVADPCPTIVVVADPSPSTPPSAPSTFDRGDGIQLEGLDNFVEPPTLDRDGIHLEGMDSGVRDSGVGTGSGLGSSKETPPKSGQGVSHWLPTLREVKLRIEQSTNAKIERLSHLDQGESPSLSLRRWAMRLLMSAASLSPADFAPPVGYLGPPESTPYYPTGDLRGDRSIAFTTAMNCLEDLEVDPQGNDAQIAAKLFELAQALSDLGLRESALDTCGYASESLDRLYIAEPNKYRLRVASALSLRANILCDLKKNNEARDAADKAVTLCKEHKGSQAGPVPELAYTLLNYAVLLCSIGLKDESAAVAFELLCEDDMGSEMENIFALCKLCISTTRVGIDDDTGMEMAEETIELSRKSSNANTQTMLAGALLAKSKILSSTGQNNTAPAISAEAVTVLRSMSAARPVFSLFLAHALDTHAHHLSEANRKGESYATRHDAVEHWQTLKVTAGDAVARPLAYSLFHLANFRSTDEGKNARREELQLAESAVDMFRQVVPLDAPGLGDALYHVATRMLDLDDNREAATYAEESIQYFRDASAEDPKYERDLILSLSLASSCLACTERGHDAFEYAKQAVELHHDGKVEKDEQYNFLLRKLLMDAMVRAGEIDRHAEALPYFQELQAIGGLGDAANAMPDLNGMPRGFGTMPMTNGGGSFPSADKGKGREFNAVPGPSTLGGRRLADDEIFSPGAAAAAAAQRRLSGLGGTGPPQGNMFGGGPGGNDMLSGLLGGMGGGRGRGGGPGMGPGMGGLGGNDMMSGLLGAMGGGGGRGGGPGMSPGMGGLGGDDMMSGLLGAMGRGRGGPGASPGMGGLGGSDLMSGLLGGMGRGRGMGSPGMGSPSGLGTGGRTLGGSGIPGMGMGGGGGGMDGPGLGMGGLGMGGLGGGMRGPPGSGGRPGAGAAGGRMGGMGGLGGLDDMGGLGGNIDSLISNLGKLGPDFFKDGKGEGGSEAKGDESDRVNGDSSVQSRTSSPKPRTGTWSGMGIQSNLKDEGGA